VQALESYRATYLLRHQKLNSFLPYYPEAGFRDRRKEEAHH